MNSNIKYSQFENIIFDLGGVIIDINFQLTNDLFNKLGIDTAKFYVENKIASDVFIQFQKGKISAKEFRDEVCRINNVDCSEETFDEAWNAMVLDSTKERVQLLSDLNKVHRTFLLSNTNIIHCEQYTYQFKQKYGISLSSLFEKAYYSHELGMEKPDEEIFTYVLEKHRLKPEDTLFVDDTLENIQTAVHLGMATIHLQPPKTILNFQ